MPNLAFLSMIVEQFTSPNGTVMQILCGHHDFYFPLYKTWPWKWKYPHDNVGNNSVSMQTRQSSKQLKNVSILPYSPVLLHLWSLSSQHSVSPTHVSERRQHTESVAFDLPSPHTYSHSQVQLH